MMRHHPQPSRAHSYRWWIHGPGTEETIDSIVERADRLYSPPPDGEYAWREPAGQGGSGAVSSTRELYHLAHMIGVSGTVLGRHRLEDAPSLLAPAERRAYCPSCLEQDRACGRPRAFRGAWARFFLLTCSTHDVPLHWAEPRLAAIADNELMRAATPPVDPSTREILAIIDGFAGTLEACLWGRRSWPSGWLGDAHAARALLIRCLTNLITVNALLPITQLWLAPIHAPYIAVPTRPFPPLHGPPWETVRCIGRPAWRRAALWLTLSQVQPALPERLRPETLPIAFLGAADDWWSAQPPLIDTRRLRRVFDALRRQCSPYPVNRLQLPEPRTTPRRRRRVQRLSDDESEGLIRRSDQP